MIFDGKLNEGVLLRRYKRFFADVATQDGSELTVHCANTGSMTGCSTPGNRVWYSTSNNPKRKLKHSLELIETDGNHLVCVNTARANQLVANALLLGLIHQVPECEQFRREFEIPGESGRFDFGSEQTVIEVKSVTWGHLGIGKFPDAPSERATRHVTALQNSARFGYRAILLFAVLHTGINKVTVASEVDSTYARSMENALRSNVQVLAYRWNLSPTEMTIDQEIPFFFDA